MFQLPFSEVTCVPDILATLNHLIILVYLIEDADLPYKSYTVYNLRLLQQEKTTTTISTTSLDKDITLIKSKKR